MISTPTPVRIHSHLALISLESEPPSPPLVNHSPRNMTRDMALAAVRENPPSLQYLEAFNNDKGIVLEAIRRNAFALKYASDELKNNPKVILEVIRQNPFAFEYANPRFREDKQMALVVVQRNGITLQFFSEKLKNDFDVALLVSTSIS